MGSLSYNTKMFTDVNKYTVSEDGDLSYKGILIAGKLSQKNGQDYPIIDAIDIDWDGAWVSTFGATYLHTTEDLIDILNELSHRSDTTIISGEVDDIAALLESVAATYVTNSKLGDILLSYQNKLHAGANIAISDDMQISAYGIVSDQELADTLMHYATKQDIRDMSSFIASNFYDRTQTDSKLQELIDGIVDGAADDFNTLGKISEWITGQDRYEAVDDEYINANPDAQYYNIIRYIKVTREYMSEHSGLQYYAEATEGYRAVDEEFIRTHQEGVEYYVARYAAVSKTYMSEHQDEQYYIKRNNASDISDLITRLNALQDTVGYKNYVNGTYTYTGILAILEGQRQINENIMLTASSAMSMADNALNNSNEALHKSTTAYEAAAKAYDYSVTTYDVANTAYSMSVSATEAVGHSGSPEQWIEMTDEMKAQVLAGEADYETYYRSPTGIVSRRTYTEGTPGDWLVRIPAIEGTGLTGRVDDAETTVEAMETTVTELQNKTERKLYDLYVDNTNSSYVTLALDPSEYMGETRRTIKITTGRGDINTESGEVVSEGIADMVTMRHCFSYASTWKMLDP